MQKAYIVISKNFKTGYRRNSPAIYDNYDEAKRGVKHSLARSMRCLTKSSFSIYSEEYDDSQYDYELYDTSAYIYERNTVPYVGRTLIKSIQILQISIPDFM